MFLSLLRQLFWPSVAGVLFAILIVQTAPEWLGLEQPEVETENVSTRLSYADAVRKAIPSVVSIYTTTVTRETNTSRQSLLSRQSQPRRVQSDGLGSGIIMDESGYLLTNHHVISGVDRIVALLHDGRIAEATVVGSDPDTDIAVLKIELPKLIPITIGDPDAAQVGDVVLAIGNPYGFGHTVTQGIISATGRYNLALSTPYQQYIQTDATINRGNSGGPLTDAEGNLVGINSVIYSQTGEANGIGLAIPADIAVDVMQAIIQYGKVTRGWMGVQVEQMLQHDLEPLGLNQGLMIISLADNGPAKQAKLQEGDIITGMNGRPIHFARAAMNRIALTAPGQGVDIEFVRDGKVMHTEIIVGKKPENLPQLR